MSGKRLEQLFFGDKERTSELKERIPLSLEKITVYLARNKSLQEKLFEEFKADVRLSQSSLQDLKTSGLRVGALMEIMQTHPRFALRIRKKMQELIAPMSETDSLENLNRKVSEAQKKAEELDLKKDPKTAAAFLTLSRLEEDLASLIPVQHTEGLLSRREALSSALKAKDQTRAKMLAQRFAAEEGISEEYKNELEVFLDQTHELLK